MVGNNHNSASLSTLLERIGRVALRGVNNRVELLAVEWQEERLRLRDIFVWAVALLFLATMGALLLTATIVLLFPEGARIYVTAALGLLYFSGAVAAWFVLRGALKREPFAESIDQVKKDRLWLQSLK